MTSAPQTMDPEVSVRLRYSAGAQAVQPALCCPVRYNAEYLEVIPSEILERDYGCGDPTQWVRPGDTVLDLGSGGGKVCYIAAQVVGAQGKVIGVDCNSEMLALARRYQDEVASKLGYSNVEFRCGLIQDLRLDLDLLTRELQGTSIRDRDDWLRQRALEDQLRRDQPLVSDDSIDCVVSNCVLNLVRTEDRRQLFAEIFRVLKRGGRAVISDIVSDEDVPVHLQQQPELWSGCISGAFREDRFLQAFEEAGFHGISIVSRTSEPWQTVEGIEFRSVTVQAFKGKQGPCMEHNQAVIYRGPFRKVEDDDGHVYPRGERMAVCEKTFRLLQSEPYTGMFDAIEPLERVPAEQAEAFDCRRSKRRDPKETKGAGYRVTSEAAGDCCGSDTPCC
ncbi:MAG: methyltransferase domain-containing protein [Planctomycetaceae bacterium]